MLVPLAMDHKKQKTTKNILDICPKYIEKQMNKLCGKLEYQAGLVSNLQRSFIAYGAVLPHQKTYAFDRTNRCLSL